MPVTMQQVLAYLDADEPLYREAANLGEEAFPHLMELIAHADAGTAAKAAYLAGSIDSERSLEALRAALARRDPVVRVAAASVLSRLPLEAATPLLVLALRDSDPGVSRVALDALPPRPSEILSEALEHLARSSSEPGIRTRSLQILADWRERERPEEPEA